MMPDSRATQQFRDGELKVAGQIPYALNVDPPRLAHALCVRSPHAHARILSIDAARAEALDGVICVLTRADLEGSGASRGSTQEGLDSLGRPNGTIFPYYGAAIKDQPIVAIDKVRHVGDVVAAVVAESTEVAAQAAALVEVEYEELPAVFDALEALEPDAPLVHERIVDPSLGVQTPSPQPSPARGEGVFYEILATAGIRPINGTNLINHMKIRRGDVALGLAESDLIVEEVYSSPALQHCTLESHVTVAAWEDNELTIWSATQMPHFVRQQLADVFRIPAQQVRVLVSTLGGGYGSKTYTRMEPLAAVLARKAGRPVKLVLSRAEEFVTTTKHEARVRIKTGVKRDGAIQAREVEIYYNAGAYADRSGTIARSGGVGAIGPYRVPNVKVDAYAVYTNRPNAVPFRGLAVSQVAWAYECHTDEVARRLGMDPLEFRKLNLLGEGDTFCTGEEMHDVHFRPLLEDAAAAIGYSEPLPAPTRPERVVGRGLGVIIKHMGSNPATTQLQIRLDADGSLFALSSTVEVGQGARAVLAREVARALSVPEDRVQVPYVDTDATPPDQGTSSSRSTFFNVMAAQVAAEDVRKQLRELAGRVFEVQEASVEVQGGLVYVPTSGPPSPQPSPRGRRGSFAPLPLGHHPGRRPAGPRPGEGWLEMHELLQLAGVASITGTGSFRTEIGLDPETGQGKASHHWHQAAAGAVVEVDRETGKVYLLRLHLATHAGRVVDRLNAELQNEGCAAFGLSQALFEEISFDGGQVLNPNLSDYNIASMMDFPVDFTTTLAESADPDAEVHGLGETGLPAVPPAIGNAVRDALGVRIPSIPLVPERVLSALDSQA